MWPRKKGKQIDCISTWLTAWALYEQVMVYSYPQRYSELAYYRNLFIQQDKKFIRSAVQMYDIRFCMMCTHHSCPFTTTEQALMATILNATAVKTLAHKCVRCRGLDHLGRQVFLSQDCLAGDSGDYKEGCVSEADI